MGYGRNDAPAAEADFVCFLVSQQTKRNLRRFKKGVHRETGKKLDKKRLRSSRASQSSILLCVAMCGKYRSQWKNIQDTDAC